MDNIIQFDPTLTKVEIYRFNGSERLVKKFNLINTGTSWCLPKGEALYEVTEQDLIILDLKTNEAFIVNEKKFIEKFQKTFYIGTPILISRLLFT